MQKTWKFHKQSGASLVEAIIAMAILGFLFASSTALLTFSGSRLTQQRLRETKSRLYTTLKRISAQPAALRSASLADPAIEPFNAYFRACANGGDWTIPCWNHNRDGEYRPFRLYLPTVVNTQDEWGRFALKTSGAITGTPAYPMRYTANGKTCDTSVVRCAPTSYPIEAFTEFLPVCPPIWEAVWRGWTTEPLPNPVYPDGLKPTAQCPFARYTKVRLTIRPSDASMDPVTREMLTIVENVTIDNALVRAARQ